MNENKQKIQKNGPDRIQDNGILQRMEAGRRIRGGMIIPGDSSFAWHGVISLL